MKIKTSFLEKLINGRIKAINKAGRMRALGEKVKLDIQNMNNIQYQNIGDYELPVNPSPAFSYMGMLATFSDWADYGTDFTPTRVRALEIKRKYQPLTKAEEKELIFWERTRNKKALADEAEQRRDNRMIFGEVNKNLRHWL